MDEPRPYGEVVLDPAVSILRVQEHLKARPGADRVVRKRRDDPASIRVVLDLVAGACAKYLAHGGIGLRVRRQEFGGRPVAGVVLRGLGRVEAGLDPHRQGEPRLGGLGLLSEKPHMTAPPAAILVMRSGHLCPLVACFEAKKFATLMRSPTDWFSTRWPSSSPSAPQASCRPSQASLSASSILSPIHAMTLTFMVFPSAR